MGNAFICGCKSNARAISSETKSFPQAICSESKSTATVNCNESKSTATANCSESESAHLIRMESQYAVKIDTDFDNPRWIERHQFMFNFLDKNNDGWITLDEIVSKASDDVCANLGATAEQTKVHQDAVEAFFKAVGLDYGKKLEFPEYLEGWKRLATSDLEKWAKNEVSLIRIWGDAVFAIFDKDGDGSISLDEWISYGKISGICPTEEDCKSTFKLCDLDKNQTLDVDEMTRQHLGFWYTMDATADGLYGNFVP